MWTFSLQPKFPSLSSATKPRCWAFPSWPLSCSAWEPLEFCTCSAPPPTVSCDIAAPALSLVVAAAVLSFHDFMFQKAAASPSQCHFLSQTRLLRDRTDLTPGRPSHRRRFWAEHWRVTTVTLVHEKRTQRYTSCLLAPRLLALFTMKEPMKFWRSA